MNYTQAICGGAGGRCVLLWLDDFRFYRSTFAFYRLKRLDYSTIVRTLRVLILSIWVFLATFEITRQTFLEIIRISKVDKNQNDNFFHVKLYFISNSYNFLF